MEELVRLTGSWPFTSNPTSTYDDKGRPLYDRAVGSDTLAFSFAHFYTDGVWATPADTLNIEPIEGTMNVEIRPGFAVILGHMAPVARSVKENVPEPWTFQLDTTPTRGNQVHAFYLRYDNNQEYRSLYVVHKTFATVDEMTLPEEGAAFKELRIGYVSVPSNATDLSDADFVCEKGLEVCPVASAVLPLDLSGILHDAQYQANRAYLGFVSYLDTNKQYLESAIDGTLAGTINNRLNALENPPTMTNSQFLYYCGITDEQPGDWPDGWLTYAQEQEGDDDDTNDGE